MAVRGKILSTCLPHQTREPAWFFGWEVSDVGLGIGGMQFGGVVGVLRPGGRDLVDDTSGRCPLGSTEPWGRYPPGFNIIPVSPVLSYPWTETEPALHRLAAIGAADPYDDVAFDFTNPLTGGHVLPTFGCRMQMLRAGVHTRAHRHAYTSVYHVFRGSGSGHHWAGHSIPPGIPNPIHHPKSADKFKPIATNVPGLHISELMPHTARVADKVCVLRATSSDDNAHSSSGYAMLTGYPHQPKNFKCQAWPAQTTIPVWAASFVNCGRAQAPCQPRSRFPTASSTRTEASGQGRRPACWVAPPIPGCHVQPVD